MNRAVSWGLTLLAVGSLAAQLLPLLATDKDCDGPHGGNWCRSNLKQIGLAMILYQKKNQELVPPFGERRLFDALYEGGHLSDGNVYVCTADRQRATPRGEAHLVALSYRTWPSGPPIDPAFFARNASRVPVAWDGTAIHEGFREVLSLDGHVEELEEDRFLALVADAAQEFGFER